MDPANSIPPGARAPSAERRHFDRSGLPPPGWLGQRVGTPDEVEQLNEALAFSARQMRELRVRYERLMAVNSDLRYRLGEMTLRWLDTCGRLKR